MTDPQKINLLAPRFDWMQNTIHEDPDEITEVLAGMLDADVEQARGLNGYQHSRVLKRRDESLARILYGGPNGWPNVIASGPATDDVDPVMRAAWERREVTRLDTAQDFDEEGGYDRVAAICREVAGDRIATSTIDSTKNGVRSRTLYVGSPSSRVRVRLYEKGRFERQMGNREAPENWFRLEAQIRPKGEYARQEAAHVNAMSAWGFSRWTLELAVGVMGLDVPQITMQPKREPDYMRAIHHLEKQYRGTLERAIAVEGSWDAVGRLLGVLDH